MAGAPQYLPKGVPASVLGYWRPSDKGETQNDMIAVLRGAKNPVLAHAFLNFMLDNKNGLENVAWNGYMPPLTSVDPDTVARAGLHPEEPRLDDRPRVGLQEGRDDRRPDGGRTGALAERVVELQSRLTDAGTRSAGR